MRHHHLLRTTVGLTALTALLVACSDDADDSRAQDSPDSSTAAADLPDGITALPGPDSGEDFATLSAGRYRVPLGESLSFDLTVPDDSYAHDNGLFIAHGSVVVKTEIAGPDYGVPVDACTDHTLTPAGTSAEDLVAAMSELAPYTISAPAPAELGGADGTYFEVSLAANDDSSGCTAEGAVELPGNPDTAVSAPAPYVGRWWVLDVDGQRVVVQQNCWECADGEFEAADAITESIAFTPAG